MSSKGGDEGLIKITDLAKETPYTAEYLSLRARQGKLKAKKINHIWFSTRACIIEYRKTQEARQNIGSLIADQIAASQEQTTTQDLVGDQSASSPWLIKWLVIPMSLVILIGFVPLELLHKSFVLSMGIVNDLADESSKSLKEQLVESVGQRPSTPLLIHNFLIYSRTIMAGAANKIAQPISRFYEQHPLLLVSSHSNWPELRQKFADHYATNGVSGYSLATRSIGQLADRLSRSGSKVIDGNPEVGQVAGVQSTIRPARVIELTTNEGQANFLKDEASLLFVAKRPIVGFSIAPSRTLAQYQPAIQQIDPYTIEIKLQRISQGQIPLLWRAQFNLDQ